MQSSEAETAIRSPHREHTAVIADPEPDVEGLPVPTGDPVPSAWGYDLRRALDVLRNLDRNTEALAKALDFEIAMFPWAAEDCEARTDGISRIAHLAQAVREAALKAVRAGDRIAREARPGHR